MLNEGVAREELEQTVCQRLDEEQLRRELGEIFVCYVADLEPILTIATAQSDGIRPTGLENEVYACFHHISRALSAGDHIDSRSELVTARRTHLKRAILDSYKIAINSYLKEETKIRDLVDYLPLVGDFSKCYPAGMEKIMGIKQLGRTVRNEYNQAMTAERKGEFELAMALFQQALDHCTALHSQLAVFREDKTYLLALAREQKEADERRKETANNRLTVIAAAILSAVLTAILTSASTYFVAQRSWVRHDTPAVMQERPAPSIEAPETDNPNP